MVVQPTKLILQRFIEYRESNPHLSESECMESFAERADILSAPKSAGAPAPNSRKQMGWNLRMLEGPRNQAQTMVFDHELIQRNGIPAPDRSTFPFDNQNDRDPPAQLDAGAQVGSSQPASNQFASRLGQWTTSDSYTVDTSSGSFTERNQNFVLPETLTVTHTPRGYQRPLFETAPLAFGSLDLAEGGSYEATVNINDVFPKSDLSSSAGMSREDSQLSLTQSVGMLRMRSENIGARVKPHRRGAVKISPAKCANDQLCPKAPQRALGTKPLSPSPRPVFSGLSPLKRKRVDGSGSEGPDLFRTRKPLENSTTNATKTNSPALSNSNPRVQPQPVRRLERRTPGKPYVRPSHPRVPCPLCPDRAEGFRGDHELRRHTERVHRKTKKIYVVRNRSNDPSFLSKCKACSSGRTYGIDYNATAHLRRQHFNASKNPGIKVPNNLRDWIEVLTVENTSHPPTTTTTTTAIDTNVIDSSQSEKRDGKTPSANPRGARGNGNGKRQHQQPIQPSQSATTQGEVEAEAENPATLAADAAATNFEVLRNNTDWRLQTGSSDSADSNFLGMEDFDALRVVLGSDDFEYASGAVPMLSVDGTCEMPEDFYFVQQNMLALEEQRLTQQPTAYDTVDMVDNAADDISVGLDTVNMAQLMADGTAAGF